MTLPVSFFLPKYDKIDLHKLWRKRTHRCMESLSYNSSNQSRTPKYLPARQIPSNFSYVAAIRSSPFQPPSPQVSQNFNQALTNATAQYLNEGSRYGDRGFPLNHPLSSMKNDLLSEDSRRTKKLSWKTILILQPFLKPYFFLDGLKKLEKRWAKCIELKGVLC
ncbi:hypothetical protein CEXT_515091 [Caerostris extrusa]|uniref:Uncharacterized protein n=1 Tax=Caerostris extrusa TaxID=172846 RepID=A0AAV4QAA8_CAEEX|nr:hypothetical protein CEXT_515091 [Caerostris extrusa]